MKKEMKERRKSFQKLSIHGKKKRRRKSCLKREDFEFFRHFLLSTSCNFRTFFFLSQNFQNFLPLSLPDPKSPHFICPLKILLLVQLFPERERGKRARKKKKEKKRKKEGRNEERERGFKSRGHWSSQGRT